MSNLQFFYRSDGSVEIWNLSNNPFIEKTLLSEGATVEALCWCSNRLFSVGARGELIEYDLQKLKPRKKLPLTGDSGWCMTAHSTSNRLLIGTELGYVNLINIDDEHEEDNWNVRLFDKQDGRVLCIAIDAEGNWAATGSTDTVRVWNVETGHAVHRLNVGRSHTNQESLVWSLSILDDLTIISGDSRGCITFWDGKIGAQLENHQSHSAAVLTICVSEDQKTVYCSGIDPLIVSYERVTRPTVGNGSVDKWVRSLHRKVHEHDVRVLMVNKNGLYSAGIDGYLACSIYPPKSVFRYPPLLQNPSIHIANSARYILLRHQNYIEIWKLGKDAPDVSSTSSGLQLEDEPVKLLTLQARESHGNIISAAISPDGRWILYSTLHGVRLFHFQYENDSEPQLNNVSYYPSELTSCLRAIFTPKGNNLIVLTEENKLQIYQIKGEQIFYSTTINASENGKNFKDSLCFSVCIATGKLSYNINKEILA